MMPKTMIEYAIEFVEKSDEPVTFQSIWSYIRHALPETQDASIGRFYKLITLDGRFVAVGGNKWTLKSRYSFKELYDDSRGVYREVEDLEVVSPDEEDPFEDTENGEEPFDGEDEKVNIEEDA
jgi:DNA-directed RNA polymerase subunit delta